MKRPLLATPIKGPADRLSVDRHNYRVHGGTERTRPRREAPLETPGIDQQEHPPEGVMGWDAIGQRAKCAQPADRAAAIERDVFPTLGPWITAQTAITRISISRYSTLPPQRGSSKAENSSTKVLTDMRASRSQGDPSNHTKFHAVKYLGDFHA